MSLGQLRGLGLGYAAVDHRVRQGRLHRVHRGVFAVGHPGLSREGHWLAAVLALGERAVLSHASAAALWGLRETAQARIDVTVATAAGRDSRVGLRIHRSERLDATQTTRHRAIPVTTPARTLLDLAEVVPARALARALDEAEVLRRFDARALQAVLAANPGRAGSGALAHALADRDHDAPPLLRSPLEARFLELCAADRLPRPATNVRLGPYEVDALWPEQRLVVELDGHRHHGTRAAFERDRARDARLAVAGYRTVRVTHRQLARAPAHVVATLRALLSRAR